MREAQIHPSAVVDEPAQIGCRTKVWHFCHICAGATVGCDCVLGQNVFVASTAVVGDRCRIQNNVSIFDGVVLEADVFIGPSVVFTNVINPRAMISRRSEFRTTRICRGATVGANATILPGVTLGPFCFVGAGAVVTRDVAAHSLVIGVPAVPSGWMSRSGHRLTFAAGESETTCPISGDRYRLNGTRLELCPRNRAD
jgi:UDP-2-acetamido-3-amino-2,3-dideoxy-glucuronate N-acetyltransferase